MSTNDVPGHNPANADELAMGCWAEHDDGSLILVENTEGNRVIYSIFDVRPDPPVEYRDALVESTFKARFSWNGKNEKWTWHDKTQFPWDRIIKRGARDGLRLPSADHVLTAAERVADSLKLRGQTLDRDNIDHRMDRILGMVENIGNRILAAVTKMPRKKGSGGRSAQK